MYRFLISRRWAITTLLALLLIPTMIRLGIWQLHRHEARVARNTLIAGNLYAKPVPIGSLTKPGYNIPTNLTWRAVSATGHYDSAHEFVVRQRTDAGAGSTDDGDGGPAGGSSIGYFVITPLVTADGDEVLVNRGWVDSGASAVDYPKVPSAPAGQVTVRGRLRADETSASSGIRDRGGLPDRQYMLINSEQQAPRLGAPLLGGYIELVSTSPKPAKQPQLLPEPDHSGIGPHMAYTVQWWLFAAMVPVGWVILARREAKELAEQRAKDGAQNAGAAPDPSSPADSPADSPAAAAVPDPSPADPPAAAPVPATARQAASGGE